MTNNILWFILKIKSHIVRTKQLKINEISFPERDMEELIKLLGKSGRILHDDSTGSSADEEVEHYNHYDDPLTSLIISPTTSSVSSSSSSSVTSTTAISTKRRYHLQNNTDDFDTENEDGSYLILKRKRLTHWAFIAVGLLFILLLLYIPIFNNVQTRIGEDGSLKSTICLQCTGQMHENIVAIPGWNFNTSRDTTDYVLPNQNTSLIEPVHVQSEEKIFLLIVVCSSADHFQARQSIRETWGNVTEFNYSYFSKIHSNFKGKYLQINYNHWKEYFLTNLMATTTTTTSATTTTSTESSIIDKLSQKNKTSNESTDSHEHKWNDNNNNINVGVKVVFLLGQTTNNDTQFRITYESDLFGDIIQESFVDSYNNLTLKTVMLLKWVTNNYLDKVKFVMKCDDDIFVNVPNLMHILLGGTVPVYNDTIQFYDDKSIKTTDKVNRLLNPKNLLIGYLFCNAKPIADVNSKWYSPVYMYSGNIYPNYLSGTGYIMSTDTVKILYNASLHTPLFHLEDVYLTGICASKIKLRPRHHPLFTYTLVTNLCAMKGMITQHQLSPSDIRRAYDFVTNTTINCPPPDKTFKTKKIRSRPKFCQ